MDTSEIDLLPLRKAIQRLSEGLFLLANEPQNTLLRDGVIQRFEFTYELSHKMLRRFLEAASPNPEEISALSFQDLIRVGNDQGLLLSPWTRWRTYRQARTNTSHTYDEAKAMQVMEVVPAFLSEAQEMLRRLEGKYGGA